jgi:hypothetical protein
MRDELIALAQRQVLQQAVGIPSICSWNWPSRPLAQARRSALAQERPLGHGRGLAGS